MRDSLFVQVGQVDIEGKPFHFVGNLSHIFLRRPFLHLFLHLRDVLGVVLQSQFSLRRLLTKAENLLIYRTFESSHLCVPGILHLALLVELRDLIVDHGASCEVGVDSARQSLDHFFNSVDQSNHLVVLGALVHSLSQRLDFCYLAVVLYFFPVIGLYQVHFVKLFDSLIELRPHVKQLLLLSYDFNLRVLDLHDVFFDGTPQGVLFADH